MKTRTQLYAALTLKAQWSALLPSAPFTEGLCNLCWDLQQTLATCSFDVGSTKFY